MNLTFTTPISRNFLANFGVAGKGERGGVDAGRDLVRGNEVVVSAVIRHAQNQVKPAVPVNGGDLAACGIGHGLSNDVGRAAVVGSTLAVVRRGGGHGRLGGCCRYRGRGFVVGGKGGHGSHAAEEHDGRQQGGKTGSFFHSGVLLKLIPSFSMGNTAQFPPYGLSTAPTAAARHLRCQNAR